MECFAPLAFGGQTEIPEAKINSLKEAFGFLEGFLEKTGFAAGTDHLTLADLALLATYSTIETTKKNFVNLSDYPRSQAWAEKMKKSIPNYAKANGDGVNVFYEFIKKRTKLDL